MSMTIAEMAAKRPWFARLAKLEVDLLVCTVAAVLLVATLPWTMSPATMLWMTINLGSHAYEIFWALIAGCAVAYDLNKFLDWNLNRKRPLF